MSFLRKIFGCQKLTPLKQFRQAEAGFQRFVENTSPQDILDLSPAALKSAKAHKIELPDGDYGFSASAFNFPFLPKIFLSKAGRTPSLVLNKHEFVHLFQDNLFKKYCLSLSVYKKRFIKVGDNLGISALTKFEQTDGLKTIEKDVLKALKPDKTQILNDMRCLSDKELKLVKMKNLTEIQACDLSVRHQDAKLDDMYYNSEIRREIYSQLNNVVRQVERERKLGGGIVAPEIKASWINPFGWLKRA